MQLYCKVFNSDGNAGNFLCAYTPGAVASSSYIDYGA